MATQKEKEKAKKPKVKRPTAEKRLIQNVKQREQNRAFKSQIRTAIRKLNDALEKNEAKEGLQEKLNVVYGLLDKGIGRSIIKKNKASRDKSRLTAKVAAKTQ